MTKKHFEHAASLIRQQLVNANELASRGASAEERRTQLYAVRHAALTFVELFTSYNPAFSRARFLSACGLASIVD